MDRSVAVTGAGSGIGKAIAAAFAAQGDVVHLADISEARVTEATDELAMAGEVHGHVIDVAALGDVERLVASADSTAGGLAVFVNAAGVFDGYASIDETSPELWDRILRINLTGSFHCCKAASATMRRHGHGRIVLIGSVAGRHGGADGIAYTASKAGIEGMTRRLAIDLGPHGVTANVVAPGVVRTNLRATSAEAVGDLIDLQRGVGTSTDKMDWLIPVGRAGTVEEVAAAVVFLASDAASYITGQVLRIDGGWDAT